MNNAHVLNHYTFTHEMSKHNIELPIFDIITYNKILSRIGRQQKILSSKEIGSRKFATIKSSLNRSNNLKKTYINKYLSDLAIYVAFHKHDGTLKAMVASSFVSEEAIKIVVAHWRDFQHKLWKARKLYE